MCCGHVNECLKYARFNSNQVAKKFKFNNESLTISLFRISYTYFNTSIEVETNDRNRSIIVLSTFN